MMNKETITIGGEAYEVRQLSAKEGLPLLADAGEDSGKLNEALLTACVSAGGKPVNLDDIPLGHVTKLLPVIMRVNEFEAGDASGN